MDEVTPPKRKRGRPKGVTKLSGTQLDAPLLSQMLTEKPRNGQKHGGGRVRRELVDVASRLDAYQYDPIKSLVKQAVELDGATDIPSRKLRANIDDILLAYIAAKPRQIEHKFEENSNPITDLLSLIAEAGRPKPPTA